MTRNGFGDDIAFADGEITTIAHDDLVTVVSARTGLSNAESADLIAEINEQLPSNGESQTLKMHRFLKRGARKIIDSRTSREAVIKMWAFCYAMGWFDVIDGLDTCTKLAKKLGLTKADVNKHVCMFRDQVGDGMDSVPHTSGQRDNKARATFALKRMEQERVRMVKRTTNFIKEHNGQAH